MKKRIRKVPATTNNMTNAIINFLRSEGHSASRINTQGQYDEKIGRWRKSGSRNGYLDISACIKDSNGVGRYVVLDIKKGSDKLRPDQISFIKEVRSAGGIALEIETMDQFYRWYRRYISTI